MKESIAYYVNNGSSVYCTFPDDSKVFDRVEYSKLFRLLLKRCGYIMYVIQSCHMRGLEWCSFVCV